MNTNEHPFTPEELELIDSYLTGNLDAATQAQVEQRIASDAAFRAKVNEMKLLGTGIAEHTIAQRLPAYHAGLEQQQGETPIRKMAWKKWAVAASVILLSGVSIWLANKQPTDNELFASYYRPDPGLISEMGVSNNYLFDKAMIEYKQGNYPAAIIAWDSLARSLPNSDTLNYFLGSALLANGDAANAVPYFEKVTSTAGSRFSSDAYWYLAMARIKQHKNNEAREALKKTERGEKAVILEKIK